MTDDKRQELLKDAVIRLVNIYHASRLDDPTTARAALLEINRLTGLDGPVPEPCRPSESDMISRPADADLGDRIDKVWSELIDLVSGLNDRLIDLERKAPDNSSTLDPGEERSVPPVVDTDPLNWVADR